MFESVATAVGPLAVAVVMTGMGCDGSAGVRIIKKHGGATIAQDEATSVVYGMPKAAFETGCIDRVEPVDRIPHAIAETVRQVSVACG
jgi:two-component system chemotaxis response regulator CheB